MSRRQQILSFVRKGGSFIKVSGRGLIKGSAGKKMSISGAGPARKHDDSSDEELGGTVKYHNRPYQLKDTTPKPRPTSKYTPIHFKL